MSKPHLFTRSFVLAALAHLSFGISAFLVMLHLPGLLQDLGAGEAVIGRVMGIHAFSAMLCGPFVGRMLDVYGRRAVIVGGTLVYTLSVALYLTIGGLGSWVYVIRMVDGAGSVAVYAGLFTYASDYVAPARRTEGLAIFGASGLLPMALGGQLGDLILARFAYRTLFVTSLLFAVTVLALAWALRDADHLRHSREPARGILSALVQPNLLPMWFATFVFFLAVTAIFTFLKTYVLHTGFGTVGDFFTAYASVAIALRLFFGWLPDRVGPRRLLGPALLSYAAGLVALGSAVDAGQVLIAGLLCGAGHGFAFPILLGLVVGRARDGDRGSAMGIYTTIDYVSHCVGAPVLGLAIEASGYDGAYAGLAAFVIGGTLAFYAWDSLVARVAPAALTEPDTRPAERLSR